MNKYTDFILEKTKKVLSIDSPSGYTREAVDFCMEEYEKLGYSPIKTEKGGILIDLGGTDVENAILLEAHLDTLGAMVSEIKSNGRLELTPLGGLEPNNTEGENCRIMTRFDGIYQGTFQLVNASVHVNGEYKEAKRKFDNMEVVIDEKTSSKEETEKLGIMVGDIVAFEPRTMITERGYIKSRFLDDKLCVGIFLGFANYLKEEHITAKRRIYQHITVYEEVGHGACGTVPDGVTELLSVDMGCVGEGLACTEHQVSICAKDASGPSTYDVVSDLIEAAKENSIDFAVDVYPYYSSDVDVALKAGYDVRHGLIGPGVYASHGYERSHVDGVSNTFELLKAYLT